MLNSLEGLDKTTSNEIAKFSLPQTGKKPAIFVDICFPNITDEVIIRS